jgi:hypothetical protein
MRSLDQLRDDEALHRIFIANENPVLWAGSQVMAPPLLCVPYGGLLKGRQGRSDALWNGSEALKRFTGQPQKDIAIDTVILPACAGPAVTG